MFVVAKQEMHFFYKFENYSRGLGKYIQMLPRKQRDDQILLEKTPAYFDTAEVEKRIHAAISDVKMLLTVRDPVTRTISGYAQMRERLERFNKTTELYPPFDFKVHTFISMLYRGRS